MIRFALLALALWPSLALAAFPDGRNEVHTTEPSLDGTKANAPIPPQMHLRNEGGSDGAGLCVISSIIANGQYQGVPGLDAPDPNGFAGKGSQLWQTAKSRPGGYSPDKLAALVDEVMPGEGYASFLDSDPEVLAKLSAMGYPIGLTMNTGEMYDWARIAHMISNTHFDPERDLACHVDNNKPGVYTWTTATEALHRAIDGGEYWAWIWTRLPDGGPTDEAMGGAAILVSLAASVVILSAAYSRRLASS